MEDITFMTGKHIQRTLYVGIPIFVLWCMSASAAEFVVNEINDLPDNNLGDGVAITERGTVSLRSAIDEANRLPGEDRISFEYPVIRGDMDFGLLKLDSSVIITDHLIIINPQYMLLSFRAMAPNKFRVLEVASGVNVYIDGIFIEEGGPPSHSIRADRGACMYIHPGAKVILTGCMFQSGVATEAGGCIYVDHAELAVSATISGDSEKNGGAIFNDHGFIYISDGSTIGGTAEEHGGAIYNDHGYVIFEHRGYDCAFYNAQASIEGGGLYSNGGVVSFNSVSFLSNSAARGGALYIAGGAHLEMFGCSAKENSATSEGGVIYLESGSLYATMCTFGQNSAGGSGGAIYVAGGESYLLNCTITQNTATTEGTGCGGGIFVSGGLCTIGNSILAENTSTASSTCADISGVLNSLGHNLIGISEGGNGYLPSDLLGYSASPLSSVLQFTMNHEGRPYSPQNIYVPQIGSPVIDAGDTALLFNPNFVGSPCYDARLTCCPRVRNGTVDIGAIEVQEGSIDLTCEGTHSADYDHSGHIGLGEVLRIVQFFNSESFHCQSGTEDGYAPGPGDTACTAHSADYNPQDWVINLSELLRIIQFYNSGGYHTCPESEDGFCPNLV